MMMTFPVNASPPAAKASSVSEGGSGCSRHRGPDALRRSAYRSLVGMGGGGGGGQASAAFRQNCHIRRKFPVIQPLSRSRDGKALIGGFILGRSPILAKEDNQRVESENKDPEDICGRHFLFDKKCANLERTRTVIPPLPRDYNVLRPGNLHPFSLSKELSHSHGGRPFTLGYPDRYELTTSPAILCPSSLVLNGRNTFSVQNGKLSRPKVNYPTYNLLTVKDNQKSELHLCFECKAVKYTVPSCSGICIRSEWPVCPTFNLYRPVLSRPGCWSLSLFYPQDI